MKLLEQECETKKNKESYLLNQVNLLSKNLNSQIDHSNLERQISQCILELDSLKNKMNSARSVEKKELERISLFKNNLIKEKKELFSFTVQFLNEKETFLNFHYENYINSNTEEDDLEKWFDLANKYMKFLDIFEDQIKNYFFEEINIVEQKRGLMQNKITVVCQYFYQKCPTDEGVDLKEVIEDEDYENDEHSSQDNYLNVGAGEIEEDTIENEIFFDVNEIKSKKEYTIVVNKNRIVPPGFMKFKFTKNNNNIFRGSNDEESMCSLQEKRKKQLFQTFNSYKEHYKLKSTHLIAVKREDLREIKTNKSISTKLPEIFFVSPVFMFLISIKKNNSNFFNTYFGQVIVSSIESTTEYQIENCLAGSSLIENCKERKSLSSSVNHSHLIKTNITMIKRILTEFKNAIDTKDRFKLFECFKRAFPKSFSLFLGIEKMKLEPDHNSLLLRSVLFKFEGIANSKYARMLSLFKKENNERKLFPNLNKVSETMKHFLLVTKNVLLKVTPQMDGDNIVGFQNNLKRTLLLSVLEMFVHSPFFHPSVKNMLLEKFKNKNCEQTQGDQLLELQEEESSEEFDQMQENNQEIDYLSQK